MLTSQADLMKSFLISCFSTFVPEDGEMAFSFNQCTLPNSDSSAIIADSKDQVSLASHHVNWMHWSKIEQVDHLNIDEQ